MEEDFNEPIPEPAQQEDGISTGPQRREPVAVMIDGRGRCWHLHPTKGWRRIWRS